MLNQSRGEADKASGFMPFKRSAAGSEGLCEVAPARLENRHFERKTLSSVFATSFQSFQPGSEAISPAGGRA